MRYEEVTGAYCDDDNLKEKANTDMTYSPGSSRPLLLLLALSFHPAVPRRSGSELS